MKPEKFIIEVTNKLDSEYIQKKSFEAGYAWNGQPKGEIFKHCYDKFLQFGMFGNKCITQSDSNNHNETRNLPFYKFPSQAEEIVKLFEKEKEPEFKVGDWIIGKDYCFPRTAKKIDTISEGLLRYKQDDAVHPMHVRRAVDAEIEQALILEAKEKGFVVGAKAGNGCSYYEIEGFILVTKDNLKDRSVVCSNHFRKHGIHLAIKSLCSSFPVDSATLVKSYPQITINGYKAEFKDWGLDFNGGCAKIDYTLFSKLVAILEVTGTGNKKITAVKIGTGEFTASQIKEIADYYNNK